METTPGPPKMSGPLQVRVSVSVTVTVCLRLLLLLLQLLLLLLANVACIVAATATAAAAAPGQGSMHRGGYCRLATLHGRSANDVSSAIASTTFCRKHTHTHTHTHTVKYAEHAPHLQAPQRR